MTPSYSLRFRSRAKLVSVEAQLYAYKKYRGLVPGCENRHALVIVNSGRMEAYLDAAERQQGHAIGKEIIGTPEYFEPFVAQAARASADFTACARRDWRCAWEEQADQDVASAFQAVFEAQMACIAYYNLTSEDYVAVAEERLLAALGDGAKERVQEVLSAIAEAGTGELATIRERRAWDRLVRAARKASPAGSDDLIRRHHEEFAFLGAGNGNPRGWSETDLRERLQAALLEPEAGAQLRRDAAEESNPADELLSRLGTQSRLLATHLARLGRLRLAIKEALVAGAYYSNPLYEDVYRRIRTASGTLSNEILRHLRYREIIDFLREGKSVSGESLWDRYKHYSLELRDDRLTLRSGQESARRLRALKFVDADGPVLEGRCANAGPIVTGRVRLIDTGESAAVQTAEAREMQQGEVLVTGMTRPNMAAACGKAAAIVTDEGGITCHAAIIARELGIPCVVGTRNATTVLRTGDCIRIDSGRGLVERVGEGDLQDGAPAPKAARAPPGRLSLRAAGRGCTESMIVRLAERSESAVDLVGGKASALMGCIRQGNVPRGFVLTTTAFRKTLPFSDIAWAERLESSDAPPHELSRDICVRIDAGAMPQEVATELFAAYRGLGAPQVAVRSSATSEDGITASAAGQYRTFLGINNEADLLAAVHGCYRSLFSEHAIAYRRRRSLPIVALEMAVIVQELVRPKVAGVMFTTHPVTKADTIVVEAAYGLGIAVVDGTLTPDQYLLRRADGCVLESHIAVKRTYVDVAISGGTVRREVPGALQAKACLSPAALRSIAELGVSLERSIGAPADVEWAITDDERLHLLQVRPITS